jgi:hypothetical protein
MLRGQVHVTGVMIDCRTEEAAELGAGFREIAIGRKALILTKSR